LAKQAGVASANVNFATKVATVKFDPDVTGPERLAGVVEGLGYHAAVPDRKRENSSHDHAGHDHSAMMRGDSHGGAEDHAAHMSVGERKHAGF
jgi:cation transport ATPase